MLFSRVFQKVGPADVKIEWVSIVLVNGKKNVGVSKAFPKAFNFSGSEETAVIS